MADGERAGLTLYPSAMTNPFPAEGDPAPAFTLPDANGTPVSLEQFRGGAVILYFYPEALTPACTKESCEFSAARTRLADAGYTVIGISPDKPAKLARFADQEGLDLILLSDPEHAALNAYGAFGEKKNYGRTYQGVIRSTFAIDAEGTVTHAWRNVRATGHVGRVLTQLGIG